MITDEEIRTNADFSQPTNPSPEYSRRAVLRDQATGRLERKYTAAGERDPDRSFDRMARRPARRGSEAAIV